MRGKGSIALRNGKGVEVGVRRGILAGEMMDIPGGEEMRGIDMGDEIATMIVIWMGGEREEMTGIGGDKSIWSYSECSKGVMVHKEVHWKSWRLCVEVYQSRLPTRTSIKFHEGGHSSQPFTNLHTTDYAQ